MSYQKGLEQFNSLDGQCLPALPLQATIDTGGIPPVHPSFCGLSMADHPGWLN